MAHVPSCPVEPGGGSVMTDCTERSEGQEGLTKEVRL
jgi:hypothetical protein